MRWLVTCVFSDCCMGGGAKQPPHACASFTVVVARASKGMERSKTGKNFIRTSQRRRAPSIAGGSDTGYGETASIPQLLRRTTIAAPEQTKPGENRGGGKRHRARHLPLHRAAASTGLRGVAFPIPIPHVIQAARAAGPGSRGRAGRGV